MPHSCLLPPAIPPTAEILDMAKKHARAYKRKLEKDDPTTKVGSTFVSFM